MAGAMGRVDSSLADMPLTMGRKVFGVGGIYREVSFSHAVF